MEEINKKKLINFQLENLIDMIDKATDNLESIKAFKWFIETVNEDYKEQKGLYKKCIDELINIKNLNDFDYLESAKDICSYYYDCSNGYQYDSSTYNNAYRKKHYKQLNVDIPISIMEEFEHCLKMNSKTKKEFIINAINDFINNSKKS